MTPWLRAAPPDGAADDADDGGTVVATFDRQEAQVLRAMVTQIRDILAARAAEHPADELGAITGIRTGPAAPPADRVAARLLPDFSRGDPGLASGLRQLNEPDLIDVKDGVAAVVLSTLPETGGRVELTLDQAESWLSALNDVRLALGTVLDVTEDMPDELPSDDPRSAHLGVYHWLTFAQETLVLALSPELAAP